MKERVENAMGGGDSEKRRAVMKSAQTRVIARLFISEVHVMHFSTESVPASGFA